MKKFCLAFLIIVFALMFCACGKSNSDVTDNKSTEPVAFTTVFEGKTLNAQRMSSDGDNYTIGIYDDQGRGIGLEYYKDGKLSYYYVSSDFDDAGNESVQKYYDAKGKLLGSVDDKGFHDATGKIISENEMDALLPS